MKITRTATREPVPAGVFPARCYKLMHFGTVYDKRLDKMINKLRIDWELPTEMKVFDEAKGPQPLSISKDYTASFNEKSNLYKDLSSWLGDLSKYDEFELDQILGNECMVNIQHKVSGAGNTYAYVASITPMPTGMNCPPPVNPQFVWDYENHFDDGVLENMHEYFRDLIKSSVEYKLKMNPPDIQDAPPPTLDDMPNPLDDIDLK